MIRHPLVRCGLFIVAVGLWSFLLDPFGRSFNAGVLVNALAIVGATATMLALDRRGPGFIGLWFDGGWWRQALAGFAVGWVSILAATLPMLAAGYVQWSADTFDAGHWLVMAGLFLVAGATEELLF